MIKCFREETANTLPMLINPEFAERTGVFKKLKEHGIDQSGWIATSNIYEAKKNNI